MVMDTVNLTLKIFVICLIYKYIYSQFANIETELLSMI